MCAFRERERKEGFVMVLLFHLETLTHINRNKESYRNFCAFASISGFRGGGRVGAVISNTFPSVSNANRRKQKKMSDNVNVEIFAESNIHNIFRFDSVEHCNRHLLTLPS